MDKTQKIVRYSQIAKGIMRSTIEPSPSTVVSPFQHLPKNLRKAVEPRQFASTSQLSRYLAKNVLAHAPGRFVIIPKPYGVSCMGRPMEDGGVFGNGVHDVRKQEKWVKNVRERDVEGGVTISDCLKELRRLLKEPQLMFGTGLKRYLSGAIVLPCNDKDFGVLKQSIREMSTETEPPFMYRALAITIGRPKNQKGTMTGFATFRNLGKHKEYIFEDRKVTRRAKSGKFAVEGSMSWKVLDTKNDCSLIEFSVDKWARHIPRLMLTQLVSPILGDTIYWRRIGENEEDKSVVELISAGERGHKVFIPPRLPEIFDVERPKELMRTLPMYCHVYQTIFENVGGQDANCLVAESRPPTHFMTMLEVLGLTPAYKAFRKEKYEKEKLLEHEIDEEVGRSSGEMRF